MISRRRASRLRKSGDRFRDETQDPFLADSQSRGDPMNASFVDELDERVATRGLDHLPHRPHRVMHGGQHLEPFSRRQALQPRMQPLAEHFHVFDQLLVGQCDAPRSQVTVCLQPSQSHRDGAGC